MLRLQVTGRCILEHFIFTVWNVSFFMNSFLLWMLCNYRRTSSGVTYFSEEEQNIFTQEGADLLQGGGAWLRSTLQLSLRTAAMFPAAVLHLIQWVKRFQAATGKRSKNQNKQKNSKFNKQNVCKNASDLLLFSYIQSKCNHITESHYSRWKHLSPAVG